MILDKLLILKQSTFERTLVAVAILFTLNIFIIIRFDVGVILWAGIVASILVLIFIVRSSTVSVSLDDTGISFSKHKESKTFKWGEVTKLHLQKNSPGADLSKGLVFSIECSEFKSPYYVYKFLRQNRVKKISEDEFKDILIGLAVNADSD